MKIVLLICLVIFIVLMSLGYFLFSVALKRQTSKKIVFNNKQKIETTNDVPTWKDSFEKTSCVSNDGITLSEYARKVDRKNPWIIFVHGYSGNLSNMIPYINRFVDKNYNILAFDLRGHGESEGKYYGLSYLDACDINSWVGEIRKKGYASKIVLFGISMGGASSLRAASNNCQEISAVISDSAPSSIKNVFSRLVLHKFGILGKVLILITDFWMKILVGYSFNDTDIIDEIKKLKVPILLIHGINDGFVPVSMMADIYNSIEGEKDKLLISGADHTKSVYIEPDLYWNKVDEFLYKYLQ